MGTGQSGVPSGVELATTNVESAARFYGQLFGWGRHEHQEDGERLTLTQRDRSAASVEPQSAGERSAWTMQIAVVDVDETSEKVVAAAGRIVVPHHHDAVRGGYAVAADPSGARFAMCQVDGDPGDRMAHEPGMFAQGELISDDVEASAAFYGSVFRWSLGDPEGPLGRREWKLNDRSISLLLPRPPTMPEGLPPYWDVYFAVRAAATTVEQVRQLGGTVLLPATDTEHGAIAVFADPTGAVFSVIQQSN